MPKRRNPIHPSIKKRLGYAIDEPDAEVLRDWRTRLRRVCKPSWELKYCPYGPLVEQSPLLPQERTGMIEHINRLRRMLKADQLGEVEELTPERRAVLQEWLEDDDLIARQAYYDLKNEIRDAAVAASKNHAEALEDTFRGDLPPIEIYRVPFDVVSDNLDVGRLNPDLKRRLAKRIRERKKELATALKTGIEDTRRPLDAGRRAMFRKDVRSFSPEEYPETVPPVFEDGACNIFGHICPVFFTAEACTETTTERRRGRYIPFSVKMRVVRRDNHTCQHCSKHLADNEVEFDHKIPISKGGSSDEHNIRLTCFNCNREKRDKVEV